VDWRDVVVTPAARLAATIERIDRSGLQVGLVVDERGVLLGVVTDGDIRRALLRGCGMDVGIREVMNPKPRTLPTETSRADVLAFMRRHKFHHVPLLDSEGRLAGLEVLDRLIGATEVPNPVVIMAGGRGARLLPLTEECPKPLLPVGGKPILEHILEGFVEEGFRHFYFSVNYKAEMITDHFGNGERWGVRIDYLREPSPLGTAGSLSLLPARPEHPLIVMNGDLLTKVSFASLLEFHSRHGGLATMAVREYDVQIPYGVVTIDNGRILRIDETEGGRILGIDEKPVQRFFVNAGIYVLSPEAVDHIPVGAPVDMPMLFDRLREHGATMAFPLREYWVDIGRHDELEMANDDLARAQSNGTLPHR